MDAINDIIEKVCAHMKKILDAWVRGGGGPKRAQNGTFSNFEVDFCKNEQQF